MERERERPISEAEAKQRLSQMFGDVMKPENAPPRTVVRKFERAHDETHLTIKDKKFRIDPDLNVELHGHIWLLTDNAYKRPINAQGVRLEQIILQAKGRWKDPEPGQTVMFRFKNNDALDLRADNIKLIYRKVRADAKQPDQPKVQPAMKQAVEAAKVALTEFPLTLRVTGRFVADSVEVIGD